MDFNLQHTLMNWIIPLFALCFAVISVSYGLVLCKARKKQQPPATDEKFPLTRYSSQYVHGLLLILSATAWLGIATGVTHWSGQQEMANQLAFLPATASGLETESVRYTDATRSPSRQANQVVQASTMIAEASQSDIKRLKQRLTNTLLNSEHFGQLDQAISISLDDHPERHIIEYLSENQPGQLSLVYQQERDNKLQMVVYYPRQLGNSLVYSPLSGPGTDTVTYITETFSR